MEERLIVLDPPQQRDGEASIFVSLTGHEPSTACRPLEVGISCSQSCRIMREVFGSKSWCGNERVH